MSFSSTTNRAARLRFALKERILVLDGAMGTALQSRHLKPEDFGGPDLEGCNENLVLTRPDVISDIHRSYLQAGADIIETNTFGATALVLDEYGLGTKALEINEVAARLARQCADECSTTEWPRFVAGSMGPTTKAISVTGGVSFRELVAQFAQQAQGLWRGGVDYFLLETCQDTRNIKAGLLGIETFQATLPEEQRLPVAVSVTIEPMGTMLAGQSVEAVAASLDHVDLLYLGLNCATGPEFMTDHIRSLAQLTQAPVACVPNAGLPDENGHYLENPEMVSAVLRRFAEKGWLNVIGGCCGTHSGHIRALRALADGARPRVERPAPRSQLSGVDYLEINDQDRPVLVGERTNVIGSKKFRDLIAGGQFEEGAEVGRAQVKKGAAIVDICLANPDRDELADMEQFMEQAVKKIRAPYMIDSTDEKVLELALTYSQGKAIINSINLEDGEERFEKVVPLAKKYGAALVVGCIDEDPDQGMAVSRQRKLAVAQRSYDLLTKKYGVQPEDIYFDPLVFPCATGDAQYVGSAVETIEGVRLIKQHFPRSRTVLGISNVSFGLPAAGREVLNSVFLYHCVQAGLDLAIVNSEKLERFSSLEAQEKQLSEDLLWNRGADPIAAFAAHFRQKSTKPVEKSDALPLEKRLPRYILEGTKDGLFADLDEALKTMKPLEIINGPLMAGMDEVGRLFNKNELIVAEVLQSAEAMKAAVNHLEPFMEKSDANLRGKVVLATVKGDVHDIGKNLVEIILSNNGFEVINLGIKVPPEQLIQAVRQHDPDIVGLSGLLVKSAQQMVTTAEDLARAGIQTPVLVGGAALSRNFVDRFIAPAYGQGEVLYAKDAMCGLDLAKKLCDADAAGALLKETHELRKANVGAQSASRGNKAGTSQSAKRSSKARILGAGEIPVMPDSDRHVVAQAPLDILWSFINPLMLYGRHLGMKGNLVRALERGEFDFVKKESPRSLEIYETVQQVKEFIKKNNLLRPKAVYQFVSAHSQGNDLHLRSLDGAKRVSYSFPRQEAEDGLCLADWVHPEEGRDHMAAFVVTAGFGVRAAAEDFKNKGSFLYSHVLQALAIETAEAFAEWLHSQIRGQWGFSDPLEMTMMERFQAKYRGKRYSFGYPACPRLDDQEGLFSLLSPEDIGVTLTEGFMMEPEASVSALVFHHPDATYFSVGADRVTS